jgi:hypothetical protein
VEANLSQANYLFSARTRLIRRQRSLSAGSRRLIAAFALGLFFAALPIFVVSLLETCQ